MANKRGKSWDFPDYTSREELEALYKAKIRMLETRIEQLEAELANVGTPLPEEILDAYVVTDLNKCVHCGGAIELHDGDWVHTETDSMYCPEHGHILTKAEPK